MPYWGANVRHNNFVVQAKVHGEDIEPSTDDLTEFITNLAKTMKTDEHCLARIFADKIASAFHDHPYAKWITVDILTTGGRTFGATTLIKENV